MCVKYFDEIPVGLPNGERRIGDEEGIAMSSGFWRFRFAAAGNVIEGVPGAFVWLGLGYGDVLLGSLECPPSSSVNEVWLKEVHRCGS